MKDYQYDYEWDANYCYPESKVLKNKLNIKDAGALLVAEREITSLKIAKAKNEPIKGKFDLEHLQKINKLFLRIYMLGQESFVLLIYLKVISFV